MVEFYFKLVFCGGLVFKSFIIEQLCKHPNGEVRNWNSISGIQTPDADWAERFPSLPSGVCNKSGTVSCGFSKVPTFHFSNFSLLPYTLAYQMCSSPSKCLATIQGSPFPLPFSTRQFCVRTEWNSMIIFPRSPDLNIIPLLAEFNHLCPFCFDQRLCTSLHLAIGLQLQRVICPLEHFAAVPDYLPRLIWGLQRSNLYPTDLLKMRCCCLIHIPDLILRMKSWQLCIGVEIEYVGVWDRKW